MCMQAIVSGYEKVNPSNTQNANHSIPDSFDFGENVEVEHYKNEIFFDPLSYGLNKIDMDDSSLKFLKEDNVFMDTSLDPIFIDSIHQYNSTDENIYGGFLFKPQN
eukprot:TRINITY_DN1789_c0_g1_i1.p3 TRINITY_DN1789_c0_g1~~TRINITY_DN1789_c0_g1_i1.p3  ORF type:complete len:106 (-),score=21.07 TRINITY_DN1789_c0_g1_i1:74-391(-)